MSVYEGLTLMIGFASLVVSVVALAYTFSRKK
ncbi:putative holin-like toxin [Bacillus yapensis]|nr:putative holin-like toxin [Bacillus yapensis]